MNINRIRRYDQLWRQLDSDGKAQSDFIPEGFTVFCLNYLSLEERQQIATNKDLYQWAFDEAKRRVDNNFLEDWII